MSLSTWYYVVLEASTPVSVYIYAVLAILVIGAIGVWLMRKAESDEQPAAAIT